MCPYTIFEHFRVKNKLEAYIINHYPLKSMYYCVVARYSTRIILLSFITVSSVSVFTININCISEKVSCPVSS